MGGLVIQTSGACNLKCSYCCYRHFGVEEFTADPLPLDKVTAAIKKYGIDDINVSGIFETVLIDNFVELYKTICGRRRRVYITTNICARPLEWWRKLLKLTPMGSTVTIGGSIHAEHGDTGNLRECFEVYELIGCMRSKRPDCNLGTDFPMVSTPNNNKRLKAIYDSYEVYREFIREQVILKNEESDSRAQFNAQADELNDKLGFKLRMRYEPHFDNMTCVYYRDRHGFILNTDGKYKFGKFIDNGGFEEVGLL